jgi:tetratricopeptide (TPR) repeat protein
MVGSRALGVCIRKHRGHRTVQVLADALGKSARWMAYVEAGRAAPDWIDLLGIARILGPLNGPIFLKEAVLLLLEEAEVARVKAEVMAAIQRREFLGVLGIGATIDMERLGHALHGVGICRATVEELNKLSRFYVQQSRMLAPGVMVSSLQAHLRDHFELIATAPQAIGLELKASAAKVALLAGVLAFRLERAAEASHYWMLAQGLAEEGRDNTALAYAVGIRAEMPLSPANAGGMGGDPRETIQHLERSIQILGPRASGIAPATFYAWLAQQQAALGDAKAAERNLDAAATAMNRVDALAAEDLTGFGLKSEWELAAERAICAVFLERPTEVISILESDIPNTHSSLGWRAARLSDLAAAYAQQGHDDHAARLLLDATQLAIDGADIWRVRRLQGIRRRWLSDKLTGSLIEEVDQKLAAATAA